VGVEQGCELDEMWKVDADVNGEVGDDEDKMWWKLNVDDEKLWKSNETRMSCK
jgi:hypothetical protein